MLSQLCLPIATNSLTFIMAFQEAFQGQLIYPQMQDVLLAATSVSLVKGPGEKSAGEEGLEPMSKVTEGTSVATPEGEF